MGLRAANPSPPDPLSPKRGEGEKEGDAFGLRSRSGLAGPKLTERGQRADSTPADCSCSTKNRSASSAAMQPVPADVIAWR